MDANPGGYRRALLRQAQVRSGRGPLLLSAFPAVTSRLLSLEDPDQRRGREPRHASAIKRHTTPRSLSLRPANEAVYAGVRTTLGITLATEQTRAPPLATFKLPLVRGDPVEIASNGADAQDENQRSRCGRLDRCIRPALRKLMRAGDRTSYDLRSSEGVLCEAKQQCRLRRPALAPNTAVGPSANDRRRTTRRSARHEATVNERDAGLSLPPSRSRRRGRDRASALPRFQSPTSPNLL
jgi:hypothetical protein